MDCELCEKSMIDLLYGELEDGAANDVRSHLQRCDACRHAYEKLESGRGFARKLILEPAPSLAKVLSAAREQAAANRAARELPATLPTREAAAPRDAPRTAEEGSLAAWLRWLGAMVMGPQLGVATVLLLVVGIGLWYLPQLGGGTGRGAPPLLEPDPQQASETTALEPAEPLQLSHDPRTGRVTVDEEGPSVDGPPASSPASPARAEREAAHDDQRAVARSTGEDDGTTDEAHLAEIEAEIPSADPGTVQMDSLPDLSTAAGAYEGGAMPVAPPGAPTEAPAAPVRTAGLGQQIDLDSVPGGVQGGDLAAAALHGQARQLAAAGRCADSVARYHQLQSRYPTYPEGGRASMEMADCLRRLGRTRDARTALERASRSPVPAVASAARRHLIEMDLEQRAAEDQPATTEAAQ